MISVLLAAYRGEKHIARQIASILPQLEPGDELLISDDSPVNDNATYEAIKKALPCDDDPFYDDINVEYSMGPQQGVINNVESLLEDARGDILVLCDQDDVWLPGKLEKTRELLNVAKPALLAHSAILTDEALNETGGRQYAKPGLLRNLVKNSYTGCCMAFTRALLPHILPFPENIPMHDQWIGLRAEKFGQVHVVDEPYILHRRHGDTQTGQGSTLKQKLQWRWSMAMALKNSPPWRGGPKDRGG